MEGILQGLHAVEGVLGTLVVDGGGGLLSYKAHAVYDFGLLQQLGKRIVTAVDSIQLLHEDWDLLTASFGDGKLLLKNLKAGDGARRSAVLGVIAANQLNASFAGVAIRVAAGKLKAELESGRVSAPMSAPATGQSSMAVATQANSQAWAAPPASAPAVASNGLSWSGLGGSSRVAASGVSVVDPESAAFLTSCSKALAHSVGPMAKVFVKEALRKLFGDHPFTLANADALINEITTHIEDPAEAAAFNKAMKTRR